MRMRNQWKSFVGLMGELWGRFEVREEEVIELTILMMIVDDASIINYHHQNRQLLIGQSDKCWDIRIRSCLLWNEICLLVR
jgi:hypothetical protein